MIFNKITAFFMSLFITLGVAFSALPSAVWFGQKTYSPAAEDALLSVSLISDTHSDSGMFHERSKILRRVMCGISRTDSLPDAIVIAGDVSNASDPKEYARLEQSMSVFNRVPAVLPAAGNHDVRACDTYAEAAGYFCDFAGFCGIETEKTYYSAEVKGCHFIVLGSEDKLSLEASISPEQLNWFDAELKSAAESDMPVFIICHQPLYNSNNVAYNPGAEKNYGVGDSSAAIEEIIGKYATECTAPVFFINGHLHHNFDAYTVDGGLCENLYCITLPSVTKTADGGLGMALEVYADRVMLRAINYLTLEFIEGYQYTVPLE